MFTLCRLGRESVTICPMSAQTLFKRPYILALFKQLPFSRVLQYFTLLLYLHDFRPYKTAPTRFELALRESKSRVLPLHQGAINKIRVEVHITSSYITLRHYQLVYVATPHPLFTLLFSIYIQPTLILFRYFSSLLLMAQIVTEFLL